jgi:hypothetical protein
MFICTYYIVLYMYALYVRNMYHVFFSPSSFFIVSIFYILSCHVLVLRLTLLRITCLKVYRGTPHNTAAASMVQRKHYRQLSRVDIRHHTMQLHLRKKQFRYLLSVDIQTRATRTTPCLVGSRSQLKYLEI